MTMTPAPLPPEEIERLKTLLAEATEGPWMLGADHERIILEWRDQHGTMRPDAYTRNGWAKTVAKVSETSWRPIQQQVADGRLLAAAVNALPALLAEIEAARAGAERVRDDATGTLNYASPEQIARETDADVQRWSEWFGVAMTNEAGSAICRAWAIDRRHIQTLQSELAALRQAAQPSDGAPDRNCVTLPNGDCIGTKGCMHDAQPATPEARAQVGAQPAGRVEHPPIGAKVRVNSTCRYFADWQGTVMTVVGARLSPSGEVTVDTVEGEKHRDGRWLDHTDGWLVSELDLIATPPTSGAGDEGDGR